MIHNVAQAFGKTATFMPKPVFGDNGSGMHCHQSIWKDGKPLFAGNKYADLSQECLWYIGGILKHAKALNAFTNPSTNSYSGWCRAMKRRCCSPIRRATVRPPAAFRMARRRSRSASKSVSPIRRPTYLAFAAMLMAGLDGIENKIDPGGPMDKNLYDLPPAELKNIPTVCACPRSATAVDADRKFLTKGNGSPTNRSTPIWN